MRLLGPAHVLVLETRREGSLFGAGSLGDRWAFRTGLKRGERDRRLGCWKMEFQVETGVFACPPWTDVQGAVLAGDMQNNAKAEPMPGPPNAKLSRRPFDTTL